MWPLIMFPKNNWYLERKILLSFLLFLAVGIIVSGCDPVAREEITRITSPDFMIDALLVQTNAGATTSFGYEVYFVPKGKQLTEEHPLFRGDKMKNLKLRWVQPKLFEIQYEQGRIFLFRNLWYSKHFQNFKYKVEIRLVHSSCLNG